MPFSQGFFFENTNKICIGLNIGTASSQTSNLCNDLFFTMTICNIFLPWLSLLALPSLPWSLFCNDNLQSIFAMAITTCIAFFAMVSVLQWQFSIYFCHGYHYLHCLLKYAIWHGIFCQHMLELFVLLRFFAIFPTKMFLLRLTLLSFSIKLGRRLASYKPIYCYYCDASHQQKYIKQSFNDRLS